MVYLTGDIHADPTRLSVSNFPQQKEMTKDDYVVILGDFGLVWNNDYESPTEEYWLDWLEEKPFTTLFIDGNHDNHPQIARYPEVDWHGGKVNVIRPSVLHLERGYVFDIDGSKCFAFGGARSHDIRDGVLELNDPRLFRWRRDRTKLFRVNNISWWKEEQPSEEEMERGRENIKEPVDFIFTHSPSASMIALMGSRIDEGDIIAPYFEEIRVTADYKRWYFGHMHKNLALNDKDICLYEKIERIL